MTTKTKYRIFAVLICVVIYFIYIVIATALGWKHGGGLLVLAILFGVISWVWKTAGELAAKKDARNTGTGEVIEQVESLKTGEMPAERAPETPPIPEPSSEETHVEEPVEAELPPIPVLEEVVEEASKAPEVLPEEPNTNPPSNENRKNRKKGLIILICAIAAISLSGITAFSVIVIPKNKQRKAVEELCIKGQDAFRDNLFELGAKYFAEAIKIDSTNWGIYYMLGSCYYYQKDYGPACTLFKEAYTYNSNQTDQIIGKDTLYYERYLARFAWSQIKINPLSNESLQLVQEYYSLYGHLSYAYRLMTFVYLNGAKDIRYDTKKKNKYMRTALEWANKMVASFPEDDDSYFCLAYVQSKMGENRNAIASYKKCIEIAPTNSMAYNNLGSCYSALNQKNEAFRCWRKAVELNNNNYTAIENLQNSGQPIN